MVVNTLVLIDCGDQRVWFDPTMFTHSEIICKRKPYRYAKPYKFETWTLNIYFSNKPKPMSFTNIETKEKAIEAEQKFINEVKRFFTRIGRYTK